MRVPKLRFPEFLDEVEWEIKKLSDISQIVRGGSPRPIDEYITADVSGLNWLKIADVDKESKYVTSTKEKVLSTALSKTREVNPGDLIMSNSMSFGRPYILKIKSCIHDGWIAVTQIDEQASRDYLYYLILSPKSQEYFVDNAAGSGVQNLNADIIKLLPVPISKYLEQQKIADCLSSIDELISAQSQKITTLKTHKKGLMQQLFPREGETVPRLRFSEFLDAGEWEEISLGSIGKVSMCKRILKEETKPNGDVPFYKIGTFGKQADAYIDRKIFENYKRNYSYPKNGDILISAAGTIGRLVVFDGAEAYFQDSNIVWIDNDERLIKNVFLFYCYKKVKWATDDNTIARLYNDNLRGMKIFITSILEQQKIANCLSSLDELISAQIQKLEALKTHKKGMMQQLFPAAEAVA